MSKESTFTKGDFDKERAVDVPVGNEVALLTAVPTNSGRIPSRTAINIASAGNPNYCLLTDWDLTGNFGYIFASLKLAEIRILTEIGSEAVLNFYQDVRRMLEVLFRSCGPMGCCRDAAEGDPMSGSLSQSVSQRGILDTVQRKR